MSRIRGRDTGPERKMAKLLDDAGISYEDHPKLPGTPDFVIGKIAVFCDGNFWHGRDFWDKAKGLNAFWFNKISNNILRDRRIDNSLRILGMTVIRIWESDLNKKPDKCLNRILRAIQNSI